MGFFGNFFKTNVPPGPQSLAATISGKVNLFTISRLLGNSSTLSLTASGNTNLTLSDPNINATQYLGSGASQTAVVREVSGLLAVEYPVTLTSIILDPVGISTPTGYNTIDPAGTVVATLTGILSDSAPVVTPADNRLVITGSYAAGWKLVVGSVLSLPGNKPFTINAPGSASNSSSVYVFEPSNATYFSAQPFTLGGDYITIGI